MLQKQTDCHKTNANASGEQESPYQSQSTKLWWHNWTKNVLIQRVTKNYDQSEV